MENLRGDISLFKSDLESVFCNLKCGVGVQSVCVRLQPDVCEHTIFSYFFLLKASEVQNPAAGGKLHV